MVAIDFDQAVIVPVQKRKTASSPSSRKARKLKKMQKGDDYNDEKKKW